MPIYEYYCEKCDREFEVEQRITEDPLKSCPKCRSRKVKKLISQTSFVLKGSGWYSDLYASASKGADKSEKKDDGGTPPDKPGKGSGAADKSSPKESGGSGKSSGGSKGSGGTKAAA